MPEILSTSTPLILSKIFQRTSIVVSDNSQIAMFSESRVPPNSSLEIAEFSNSQLAFKIGFSSMMTLYFNSLLQSFELRFEQISYSNIPGLLSSMIELSLFVFPLIFISIASFA